MKYETDSGSFYNYLPTGCTFCRDGAKMVLFVTGLCHRDCFYCPISEEKRQNDVTFANERPVLSDEDILCEARSMRAQGTGITGGEPLVVLERVLGYIRLLKDVFGPGHHIHLYTASIPSRETLEQLHSAGLDEIRFHPDMDTWDRLEGGDYAASIEEAKKVGLDVGIEIPSLPGAQQVADFALPHGIFLNLNELEYSQTNSDAMEQQGFSTVNDEGCAVEGSRETAEAIVERCSGLHLHFCSSRFKDRVQLRKRLLRTAQTTTREFDEVTPDGTLLYGVVEGEVESITRLLEQLDVPRDLYECTPERVELGWWVLEDIADEIANDFSAWYEECYPTYGRMVVEKTPLDNADGFNINANFY
ncbi:MAG: radical SAM protein [Methanosarcinales archaeon]|nr:radical SAM protein [ANME-2 cluster archaeon]MDF1530978.1 radical SAM protein [ANME-2 cluster archaeon]MDW7775077.1 radical SAM protein [Methanosarcinales archaeon]